MALRWNGWSYGGGRSGSIGQWKRLGRGIELEWSSVVGVAKSLMKLWWMVARVDEKRSSDDLVVQMD